MLVKHEASLARDAFDQSRCGGRDLDQRSAELWLAAMLAGDFEAAWQQSDAIRARGAPDCKRFWNGEELRGARVIVRCLHGLGDAVQMLRYAPRLKKIAGSVTFETPPQLYYLASLFCGVDEVITWGECAPSPPRPWDVQIEVMELPYIFRTIVADLPIATCYLRLPGCQVKEAAVAMGDSNRRRIGIVWASGEWNIARSIPFAQLETLLWHGLYGPWVEWWSLQGGSAALEAEQLRSAGLLRCAREVCGDGLIALAATIVNLDLVITVDTLTAHLAGALGKPAWLLLHHACDWRWMTGRDDSPWYPEMRIFRQPSPGDWSEMIRTVRRALESDLDIRRDSTQFVPAGKRE